MIKYYGGVWCQTAALTALVTITMTTWVIDENTDSFIILAGLNCSSHTEKLSCEKYIILHEVNGQLRRVYFR